MTQAVVEEPSTETDRNTFPWDSVGERNNVGVSCAHKVVARKIALTLGHADLAVCRELDVSLGRVMEAIVFEKVSVGMGMIEELHCLSSTTQGIGMGGVAKVTFHSVDDLVQMAHEKLQEEAPLPQAKTAVSAANVANVANVGVVPARAYIPTQEDNVTQDVDQVAMKKLRW